MKKIMLGNEAFARGAYEAGVNVCAAYPGTPSTEITENLAKCDEVKAQWAPNEKVALEVAIGASVGGGRALCCMKHVGLNVAADPLFTVAYTGVNGGLVIVVADDPGMHSSQNEQDSRFYARSSHIPMLEPSDSGEAKDFMKRAFEISEQFDTPVLMRSTTRLSHSRGIVEVGERKENEIKEYVKNPAKYVMMPGMAKKRHIVVEQRDKDIEAFGNTCNLNKEEILDTKIGVITSGTCYNYVKEALPNASVLKIGMVYPLPMELIKSFASKVEKLYIVEELEPYMETQIKAAGIDAVGKEIFTLQGEYCVNMIKEKIGGEKVESIAPAEIPARPPVLCPGCPHRAVFYTLNQLKLTVFADIGCYTLGALPPLNAVDTVVCMGASIGMASGAQKVRGKEFGKKSVSLIGDSTFIHSGITGLIDMVYNGLSSTVIIVDNSTTGMTGHQNHPGTGKNAKGEPAPKIDLTQVVNACGVNSVRIVDPFDLPELRKVIKEELEKDEVSVIIARRPCVLLSSEYIKPAYHTEGCKNCGMCMKLGCPALIKTDKGVVVDETLCTGCGLCTEVCKFNAIKQKAGDR